jgi:hypothetical protein
MSDDDALIPASRDDLVEALAYGLRFDERGKSHRRAVDSMAQIAAETLARYLDQAGFVVMRQPPPRRTARPRVGDHRRSHPGADGRRAPAGGACERPAGADPAQPVPHTRRDRIV